ncbi:MAG: PilZ domain-containing protein [Candidatus Competibacteraceae bacterium]|jgi:hypothetical protein
MTNPPADFAANGLVFAGRLPLAWQELSVLPDDIELRELDRANLAVLNTLFALDIHAGDHSDDLAAIANASELKRLDFKVSLLLELVGQLFAHQQNTPPEQLLILTVDSLNWPVDVAPALNSLLRLELYCNLSYPRPLILPAQVAEIAPATQGWRIKARFHAPSPALQEALERYIFLQHRHAIANQRRHASR